MTSRFVRDVKSCKNIDLTTMGNYIGINWDNLTPSDEATLRNYGYEPDCYVWEPDLEEMRLEYSSVSWNDTYYDEEELAEQLSGMIREMPYYLIYAAGCRWDGSSGYKITDDIVDIVRRGYQIGLYPAKGSHCGKVLQCTEYSHDVPQGSTTTIVALSHPERERLEDADFDTVKAFVERQSRKLEGGAV